MNKVDACTCLIPGKILQFLPGKPSLYPRIADEAYLRGAKYNPVSSEHVLYDPFCGVGGALISPAVIRRASIAQIFGSDIDADSLAVAQRNFSLSDLTGYDAAIERGIPDKQDGTPVDPALLAQFREMLLHYGCISPVNLKLFHHPMPAPVPAWVMPPESVSMVITDPPYGQMTPFQLGVGDEATADTLLARYVESLRAIRPLLRDKATVTLICDKRQEIEALLAGMPEYDFRESKNSKGQNFRRFHTLQAK